MSQIAIPYYFFRGGSSRGPFFQRQDLPQDEATLSQVLLSAIGSGHPLNIDGIGGGNAVATKVAMLSRSDDEWADIDYFFAQVAVERPLVDYKPTCGNMMVGVGPAAIEMGLIDATSDVTEVKIKAVNTGANVISTVQTPNGLVSYQGDTAVDGIDGTAAPVYLKFMNVAGSSTGSMLPTGQCIDKVEGIEVSCFDVAMPMVIARAVDFGLTGYESREELDGNKPFFLKMEKIRQAAAKKMGMGDCSESVTPKFGLVAKPAKGGSLTVRYFMPWSTHPTLAVTGSQCLSACGLTPGTVAYDLMPQPDSSPAPIILEHPMGKMEVIVEYNLEDRRLNHTSAGVIRTARKLASGNLFVPDSLWTGNNTLD